jgi:hypothetical protein
VLLVQEGEPLLSVLLQLVLHVIVSLADRVIHLHHQPTQIACNPACYLPGTPPHYVSYVCTDMSATFGLRIRTDMSGTSVLRQSYVCLCSDGTKGNRHSGKLAGVSNTVTE